MARHTSGLGAAALLLLLVHGCSGTPRVDAAREADAIRALSRAWLAADEARNVEGAVSFYAEDAVELASNTPIVVGREAIRSWYQSWLPDTNSSITFATSTVNISEAGDLAYERGTYRFVTSTSSGRDEDIGKYLTVWKKVAGEWKVAADMANSDRPLAR
jgi:uncharacterized protein (TIGR02246 family)